MRVKIANLLDKTPIWLKKFYYSDAYLAAAALLCFVSWITELPAIGFVLGSLLIAVSLVILDDITPFAVVVLFAPAIISQPAVEPYAYSAIGAIPLVAALIFHICWYPPKKARTRMFYPQLAIAFAMLLGGLGIIPTEHYTSALGYTLMLGFFVLVIYLFFAYYGGRNEYCKLSVYAAKLLTWYGILIGLEIIGFYAVNKPPFSSWGSTSVVDVGWSIDNNLATVLLFASPMAFYLAVTQRHKWFYALLGVLNFAFTVLTFSRGGILFGVIMGVITIIYAFVKVKGKDRWQIAIPTMIAVIAVAAVYFANMDAINGIIVKLVNKQDAGISGRDKLYAEALQMFLQNPLFGAGMGFHGNHYVMQDVPFFKFYWFHSTLFQIIGSTGLVGIAAFLYFYIARYGIVFKRIRRNTFAQVALLSFLGFEAYSMIDTGTFIPYPVMTVAMLLTLFVERSNEEPDTASLADNGMNLRYSREIKSTSTAE